ncbi:MAG: hypothetical protein ICV65_00715 [Flavisolibacter sp.]|nr:hypothetical protein [Flavisolibacter sp.]
MTKKLTLLFFTALALVLASCKKNLPVDLNPKNPKAPVQINFTEHNLFTEGLT